MEVMSREEWREFVLAGTRTAKAGFTRADGTPVVTPVWITLDGEDVVFTTPGGSTARATVFRASIWSASRRPKLSPAAASPTSHQKRVIPRSRDDREGD
jgi:hypothetical protein